LIVGAFNPASSDKRSKRPFTVTVSPKTMLVGFMAELLPRELVGSSVVSAQHEVNSVRGNVLRDTAVG